MATSLPVPSTPHPDFESSKRIDDNGEEYWDARDLMLLLGYVTWESFANVISKAKEACQLSGQEVSNQFRDVTKLVTTGSGAQRAITNYQLSRYACYLIAQNGDSSKAPIALAQTYFAVQSRRQELFDALPEDEKRLFTREEVKAQNKELFSTAKRKGVRRFGRFNDAGYQGLYGGLTTKEIQIRKGIGNDQLLDRAGSSELATNLFRIAQTNEQLRADPAKGEDRATSTHYLIGKKIRKTIRDIGGAMPESLPAEEHIRSVKKRLKAKRGQKKKMPPKQGDEPLAA